jgi:hypothetical protein
VKKEISPGIAIGIIAVVVLIALGFIWRTYMAPSAPVANSSEKAGSFGGRASNRERVEAMRAQHERRSPMGGAPATNGAP